MERSEPILVPEWLRSKGNGGFNPHVVTSQAGRRSSINTQRNTSSNGSSNGHDKIPNSRSYNSSSRNQYSRDKEKLGVNDTWSLENSGPLISLTGRRHENGSLGRSKSRISARGMELIQRRAVTDLRNKNHNIRSNGNEDISVGTGSADTKVSFERDFPLIGSDERTMMPDIIRVSSPGLSRGVKSLSVRSSSLLGNEGRTSALAKMPIRAVRSTPDAANGPYVPTTALTSSDVCSNGFDPTEELNQAPVQSARAPQAKKFEESRFVGNKRLIPMTSLIPVKMVLNSSDKLKPKTTAKSSVGANGSKNGPQPISSTKLGSQAVRGGINPADISKYSGTLVQKSSLEKGGSLASKDIPGAITNGPLTGVASQISAPFKNANNVKHPNTQRKAPGYSLSVANKRLSMAQLRSRNDFLNLIRKKSSTTTSTDGNFSTVSSEMQSLDENKERTCCAVCPTKIGEGKYDGDTCKMVKSWSDQGENGVSFNEVIHTAEELNFLHALGWEDDAEDVDEGLTEEEINAFVKKYMTLKPTAKLLRGSQLKMIPETVSRTM